MKKFETSNKAAKYYASEKGEFDVYEENPTQYINHLVEIGKLTYTRDNSYLGCVAWCVEDPNSWYAFDSGEEVAGPRDKKSSVMKIIGEDSCSRIDTGVYKGKNTGTVVARLSDYRSWNESCSSKPGG